MLCQFLVLAITTGKKKVLVVRLAGCAVVSVFGSGGKQAVFCCGGKVLLRPEKKVPSRLSGGLCCCVSFWFWRLRPEKKSSSRLSGGLCCCVSFWFWREIASFFVVAGFVVAGKFYYDRKKKVLVVCLAGCAVVSVFGSGDYDRKKESSSRLSGGLCCCVSF